MQIVEILIILQFALFLLYIRNYIPLSSTKSIYYASIIIVIIQAINGNNITNKSPEYFLKAFL